LERRERGEELDIVRFELVLREEEEKDDGEGEGVDEGGGEEEESMMAGRRGRKGESR